MLKASQQSFSSVKVQCCRSVDRPATPQPRRGQSAFEHRRSVPKQRSVRRSCCGSLRGCWPAGATHVQDLRNLVHQKHQHRNLLARLRKSRTWPKEHYAGIRAWMRSTQAVEVQQVPFLLTHKILDAIGRGSGDRLLDHGGLDGYVRKEFVTARLRLDGGDTVPLGLWCDGVATKWDRSESVEFVTFIFPGLGPKWSALRIPIFALAKSFVASRHTYDDVMSRVVWSLNHCCAKTWPVSRHDGGRGGTLTLRDEGEHKR